MAIIAIVLSSAVGFVSAGAHMIFWGASFGQAVGTYFLVALTLTVVHITAALMTRSTIPEGHNSLNTLDSWTEWHEQEDWRDAELEQASKRQSFNKKRRAV